MSNLIKLFTCIVLVVGIYFFSFQLQVILSKLGKVLSKRLGTFSVNKEYAFQRYVFLHRNTLLSRFYNWINEQLIAIGLKRSGVTPVGYLIFWAFISAIISFILSFILHVNFMSSGILAIIIFGVILILTRVLVAERMEKRESDVMDAVDLIIPEVRGGIKNAILTYTDNFSPSLRGDFKTFVSNIQDRGMSFSDAMYILSDNLGSIFKDFAQKAVFFEALGEPDMIDIFADIVETNRLRRELRYENSKQFGLLKTSFLVSIAITFGYFVFILLTDEFSRYFFLTTTAGQILIVIILLIVFGVLSYITTIKSRAI